MQYTLKNQINKQLLLWLWLCYGMILIMIMVGGITRLTQSGLSMVEWRPLFNLLPPLTQERWEEVFNMYQQFPEFQKVNFWMTLSDFKRIYFWEWFHRLWGQVIGLVFLSGILYFSLQKACSRKIKLGLLGIFLLGGIQGLVGWYMVKSGLVSDPHVSHFRLAFHFMMALFLILLILRVITYVTYGQESPRAAMSTSQKVCFMLSILLLLITMCWGALTAGLKAGLVYNHFPMMSEGQFLPDELLGYFGNEKFWSYVWLQIHSSTGGVQFFHRCLASITLVFILSLVYLIQKNQRKFQGLHWAILILVLFQFLLGIITVLYHVPLMIAVCHQVNATLLLTILYVTYRKMKLSTCI